MSRNGSGTMLPVTNSWNPQVNGVNATGPDFLQLYTDLLNALTQSISNDGQTPIVGNIPMNNQKLTGLAAGSATGDSLRWQQLFDQGVETVVASAAITDIGIINSNFISITGTTGITSFGTNYRGPRFLRFAGVLTLTNSATLVLPGNADITTAAGDTALAYPIGDPSAGWVIAAYRSFSSLIAPPVSKIFPITASVATNILTASILPCSFDVRSATLGSGTVNSRSIPATISLVVPATATLGTISGVSSRLILLAIDNAGTIEPAIINLPSTSFLDETGLISTTAISTSSNSVNVVYSTTARSNVPYRVVGFIDSTQATAGTWAAAPSKIQGAGGDALVYIGIPPATSSNKVQPISASVAANALTLTLNPTTLDFRSTTLGSGTVTTVSNTSPITLVISSGSTLGATNATQTKIALIAINNAGTMELATVNLLGGIDIGESGIITTVAEGGAGAADSASTIYSTTARTGVAYRLVGFVEFTQATAGIYITAPSLVDGSSDPLAKWVAGYGQTRQTVTRVAGTNYTNSTGRTITLVQAFSQVSGTSTVTVGGIAIASNIGAGLAANVVTIVSTPILNGESYSFSNTGSNTAVSTEIR